EGQQIATHNVTTARFLSQSATTQIKQSEIDAAARFALEITEQFGNLGREVPFEELTGFVDPKLRNFHQQGARQFLSTFVIEFHVKNLLKQRAAFLENVAREI